MLQSIHVTMINLIKYLNDTGKLHSCFNEIEPHIITDMYLSTFAKKKINDDEKIQMEYNKSTAKPIYKTQKGYKSTKLDNLFNDYYEFLSSPCEGIEYFLFINKKKDSESVVSDA